MNDELDSLKKNYVCMQQWDGHKRQIKKMWWLLLPAAEIIDIL